MRNDLPYENLLDRVNMFGIKKSDRTGTGTRSLFGAQLRYDLGKGFPLITSKRVHFKSIVAELLWFLSGDTNVKALQDQGVHIWDEWADASGNLGPIYGEQWRSWWDHEAYKPIDQLSNVIKEIGENPDSRRLIVSAWNAAEIPKMALAPCHVMFQFYVVNGKLSCQVYQRSADMFLGVPFNIASYALLTHIIAAQTNLNVGDLIWTGGDCHIYDNHRDQVQEQLLRVHYAGVSHGQFGPGFEGVPDSPEIPPYPELIMPIDPKPFDKYVLEDFALLNYHPLPAIKAPVAI